MGGEGQCTPALLTLAVQMVLGWRIGEEEERRSGVGSGSRRTLSVECVGGGD